MLKRTRWLKSKLNALKHGMYAKSGLLPWEDSTELEAHRKKTLQSLSPTHSMLEQIAGEIAMMEWYLVRNQRSALFFALCEPFGRQVAEFKGHQWILEAQKLIDERDARLQPIAEASKALIVALAAGAAQSKQLVKISKKIATGLNRVANQQELTAAYFLGLDDVTMKQAKQAVELQSHLQKLRSQYFELEQWLTARQQLLPQIEAKRTHDELNKLVRQIAQDPRAGNNDKSI